MSVLPHCAWNACMWGFYVDWQEISYYGLYVVGGQELGVFASVFLLCVTSTTMTY